MKQLLFAILAGFIPALVATNEAHAQKLNYNAMLELKKQAITLHNSTTATTEPISNDLSGVSARALKDFSKSHKHNVNENWSVNPDGFSATYFENDIRTTVYYTKKGHWSGSLKGYTEDKLKKELRDIVKRSYFDFDITYVHEAETVESKNVPTYIIHAEDKDRILLLRIYDGAMELWQEYKRNQ